MKKKNLRVYKDEFIRLYKEGNSIRAIASQYNVSKASIKRYLDEELEIRTRGLSDEDKSKCKELYLEGNTVSAVARELSLNYSTVKRYLAKELGKVTNGERKYDHLVADIKKMYLDGLSATDISNKFNISRQTVMDYISEEGVTARSYSETSRRYDLNEDIFDTINSDNAYILGLIFAKGGIDKAVSNSFVDISVHKDRLYLLEEIAKFIYTSDYPKMNRVDNTYNLRISSSKIVNRLQDLGVRSNISKHSINTLDKEIVPFKYSFFDGYLLANTSINYRAVYIYGNDNILSMVRDYLIFDLGIKITQNNNEYGITLEKNSEVKKLINHHDCIKSKITDFIDSHPEDKYHSWSRIL